MEEQSKRIPVQKQGGLLKHIVSFLFMIGFTAVAFYVVATKNVVPEQWIVPTILILAVIQVLLQLFHFMHLDQKGSAFYTFFMTAGIFIAVISAVGIILM